MIEPILVELLTDFGFPVVAFLLLYRMMNTTLKDNTKATRELIMYLKTKRGDL